MERFAGDRVARRGAFNGAIPALFHELAHSTLLHSQAPGAVDVTLGASELLPMVAILPFMLYQLAGFGTLEYLVPKPVNWIINIGIFCLIVASYIVYREGDYPWKRGSRPFWLLPWRLPCSTAF